MQHSALETSGKRIINRNFLSLSFWTAYLYKFSFERLKTKNVIIGGIRIVSRPRQATVG